MVVSLMVSIRNIHLFESVFTSQFCDQFRTLIRRTFYLYLNKTLLTTLPQVIDDSGA